MDINVLVNIRVQLPPPPHPNFDFSNQFHVPFKIISAHIRTANQKVGRKRENPEKNHLAHPQAELGFSHMWPERV